MAEDTTSAAGAEKKGFFKGLKEKYWNSWSMKGLKPVANKAPEELTYSEIGKQSAESKLFEETGKSELTEYKDLVKKRDAAPESGKAAFDEGIKKAKEKVENVKSEKFDKLNPFKKAYAKLAANFGGEGVGNKIFRGGGTIVGLGAMIDGTRRIVAPERDEKGERKDGVWASVAEATGGALVAYLSALAGGRNKAIGI